MRTSDIVVLIVYFVATLSLGLWLGRDQLGQRDYFTAEGRIPWWAVLISIVATETSALTLISIPGLAYLADWRFLQITLGYIVGRFAISIYLLPRYFEGELITAYFLLERRFGLATRRFASILFLTTRGLADSVRLFATAIPVGFIASAFISAKWAVPTSILLISSVTLIYAYYGGMRAVIWTDLLQTCVYVVGGVVTLYVIGSSVHGGWGHIVMQAQTQAKFSVFDFTPSFNLAHGFWAGLVGGTFLTMATHGVDQTIIQRVLAAQNLKKAQWALVGSGFVVALQFSLFLIIGTGLFFFYHGRSFAASDQIFPKFIIESMPPGMTGLILAAILAATMSVHSGALNSLSASTTHDLFLPLAKWPVDDPRILRVGRIFTLIWALVLTGGALLFTSSEKPAVTVALTVASFTFGALLGAFLLGISSKSVGQKDVIGGMSVSIAGMLVIAFGNFPIAWPWYITIGTLLTVASGHLSNKCLPRSVS